MKKLTWDDSLECQIFCAILSSKQKQHYDSYSWEDYVDFQRYPSMLQYASPDYVLKECSKEEQKLIIKQLHPQCATGIALRNPTQPKLPAMPLLTQQICHIFDDLVKSNPELFGGVIPKQIVNKTDESFDDMPELTKDTTI
jgi:hypothetical protein